MRRRYKLQLSYTRQYLKQKYTLDRRINSLTSVTVTESRNTSTFRLLLANIERPISTSSQDY